MRIVLPAANRMGGSEKADSSGERLFAGSVRHEWHCDTLIRLAAATRAVRCSFGGSKGVKD